MRSFTFTQSFLWSTILCTALQAQALTSYANDFVVLPKTLPDPTSAAASTVVSFAKVLQAQGPWCEYLLPVNDWGRRR